MKLRTTPDCMKLKDAELFPEAWHRFHVIGAPTYFYAVVDSRSVMIVFDALFLPEQIAVGMFDVYLAYVNWWQVEAQAKRSWFPRRGLFFSAPMRDYVCLRVRRQEAEWWIAAFREFMKYNYNIWTQGTDRDPDRQIASMQ